METVSNNPAVQARYESLLGGGVSHNLAEVLATGAFPGVRTDATFLKGHGGGAQFADCPAMGDEYKRITEGLGGDTTGRVYLSQLAEFPGDPRAWVSGRGDVERVCRDRGYACTGAVDYKPPREDRPPESAPAVAPDIVNAEVDAVLARDPGLRRDDVYERVEEVLSGRVDLDPGPRVSDRNASNEEIGFT